MYYIYYIWSLNIGHVLIEKALVVWYICYSVCTSLLLVSLNYADLNGICLILDDFFNTIINMYLCWWRQRKLERLNNPSFYNVQHYNKNTATFIECIDDCVLTMRRIMLQTRST